MRMAFLYSPFCKFFTGLCLGLTLSGCSLFGDDFRNRANDYQTYQPEPLLTVPDELSQQPGWNLNTNEAYPVPTNTSADKGRLLVDEKGRPVIPKPDALVIFDKPEESVISLTTFQQQALNPRLDRDGSGTVILRLDADFPLAWSVMTEAVADISLQLVDLDRSVGTFYMQRLETLKEQPSLLRRLFGAKSEQLVGYQIKLNRAGGGSYATLLVDNDTLADPTMTQLVLSEIKAQLDQ